MVEFTNILTSSVFSVYYEISGVERGGVARILIEDGIVTWLFTGPNSTMESIQLNQILSVYGEPDEVYIATYPTPGPAGLPFTLILLYADRRVMVDYHLEASLIGGKLNACPGSTGPWLEILSEEDTWTEDSIIETILGPDPRGKLLSIDEATDYDINTFTEVFVDQSSCIESPSSLW